MALRKAQIDRRRPLGHGIGSPGPLGRGRQRLGGDAGRYGRSGKFQPRFDLIGARRTGEPALRRGAACDVSGLAGIPNYRKSLLHMGFTDDDFAGGVSDRAADALLSWGDDAAIRRRIEEHWDAGADQVAIQVMPKGGQLLTAEDEKVLELLAPLT